MTSPPSPPDLIVLPPHCGLDAAADLHPLFVEHADHGPVRVDGSQVEAIGQAMLQLLLAAHRTAAGCRVEAASEVLAERLRTLGLEELTA